MENVVYVKENDLPLHCPLDGNSETSHPKVFLSIDSGYATCPYCSTRYEVSNEQNK